MQELFSKKKTASSDNIKASTARSAPEPTLPMPSSAARRKPAPARSLQPSSVQQIDPPRAEPMEAPTKRRRSSADPGANVVDVHLEDPLPLGLGLPPGLPTGGLGPSQPSPPDPGSATRHRSRPSLTAPPRSWVRCTQCTARHWSDEACDQSSKAHPTPSPPRLERRWSGQTTAHLVATLRARTGRAVGSAESMGASVADISSPIVSLPLGPATAGEECVAG